MSGVAFGYGGRPVVSGLDLSIREGEFVGIVGPSGSGKSTLVRLMLGLDAPSAGRIQIGGFDVSRLERRQVARHVGAVLQDGRLFRHALREHRSAAAIGVEAAWSYADAAGIGDDLRALPLGLRTPVAAASLSDGQVKRLLVARALAQSPRILILDEAFATLDEDCQDRLLATVKGLSMTRIVISHRASALGQADRILALKDGRLVDVQPERAAS